LGGGFFGWAGGFERGGFGIMQAQCLGSFLEGGFVGGLLDGGGLAV
jgi:hypothetical protein